MNLLNRLKDKQPLENYAKELPVLYNDLAKELTEKQFVGQLTVSKTLDLMFAYSINHLSEVYDLFND